LLPALSSAAIADPSNGAVSSDGRPRLARRGSDRRQRAGDEAERGATSVNGRARST
jgi:hypothetical protein